MEYKIRFSKSAASDLNNIKKYTCENNADAAKKVAEHIIKKIETILPENPGAGRAGRVLRTKELVIAKYPYIVPYTVQNKTIYILRILHTLKRWE